MKTIICFTSLMLMFTSISFSQSIINFQSGTSIEVQLGVDVSADNVIINGTFSGGGTINGGPANVLNLTAFIEGFYNPSSNTMVSDTIIIYLTNAVSPFAKIDSAKSILGISGVGSFIFFNVTNSTNYYIVIKHRNSIETWSNSAIAFSSGTLTYDFTPAANKAFGNNQVQVDTSPLQFGIYSGDVDQEGSIDLNDVLRIYNDAANFVTGYVVTDVNGNNVTDLNDLLIAYNNSINFVSVKKP